MRASGQTHVQCIALSSHRAGPTPGTGYWVIVRVQLCPLLAPSHFTSLGFTFLVCKMG